MSRRVHRCRGTRFQYDQKANESYLEQQLFRGKCSIQTQTAVLRLMHTAVFSAVLSHPHRDPKFSTGNGAPCNLTPKCGLSPEHRPARTSSPKSFDEENRYNLSIQAMLVEPDPTGHLTALSIPLRFHSHCGEFSCGPRSLSRLNRSGRYATGGSQYGGSWILRWTPAISRSINVDGTLTVSSLHTIVRNVFS